MTINVDEGSWNGEDARENLETGGGIEKQKRSDQKDIRRDKKVKQGGKKEKMIKAVRESIKADLVRLWINQREE